MKTDTKSWAEALSKPDDDGMNKLMDAWNLIEYVMAADTRLAASSIAGQSLDTLSS
ncbi:hypothetical protein [Pseudomonas sp.]|uniref:hypothetical protein n=1 Tax=Pseudomonas sp. TaxID=306 RepID=UPI002BD45C9B|nr:hypothetical protein [Pseudomonas sp.]HUE90559.1 hypothetical protein [Pseudomonas sp.]